MSAKNDPLEALRIECRETSMTAAARRYGVSKQLVSFVLAGRYAMSDYLADRMGYEKVWRKRKNAAIEPLRDGDRVSVHNVRGMRAVGGVAFTIVRKRRAS